MTSIDTFYASRDEFRAAPSASRALAYIRDARAVFASSPQMGAVVDEVVAWFASAGRLDPIFDDFAQTIAGGIEDVRERQAETRQRHGAVSARIAAGSRLGLPRFSRRHPS